eukprot:TRINITY_DN14262_c0_g2_i1.p1 TRINITY_DN14262_c0_g2~~TRINITY_DN14262_c0_g2_i1.p1  ORF type:complete len:608 (-),score=116.40 TRINITY_DN14262_c0_g2_i1:195-2018(-)
MTVLTEARKGSNGHTERSDDLEASEDTSNGSASRRRETRGSTTSTGTERRSSVFVDPDEMKQQVRSMLLKPTYSVADFYWKTGLYRRIATNPVFENTTLAVISVNAVWLSIDTDLNKASMLFDADPIFQIAEHLFCIYFTFEWFVRYMSFQKKRNCLRDAWFVFDTALVFMMVAETWLLNTVFMFMDTGGGSSPLGNASMLRLLRLLRLSRMARMLRSMPELMILIKGMVAASRSVFFTMCLLLIVLYVFAIMLRQLSVDTLAGAKYFESITSAMYSLLIHGTFLDNLGPVAEDMRASSYVCFVAFYTFVCIAALMVMNMLIGVLCEVVAAVAETEQEEMTVSFVKDRMEKIVKCIDEDGDCFISKAEFIKLLESPEAVLCMNDVGVDPIGLVDFADFIFDGEDGQKVELSFDQFMEVVLQLRGSNTATVKDVMTLQKVVRNEVARLEQSLVLHDLQRRNSHPQLAVQQPSAGCHGVQPSAAGHRGSHNGCRSHEGSLREHASQIDTASTLAPSPSPSAPSQSPSAAVAKLVHGPRLDNLIAAAREELGRLRPGTSVPGAMDVEEDKNLQNWAAQMEQALSHGLQELQRLRQMKPAGLRAGSKVSLS